MLGEEGRKPKAGQDVRMVDISMNPEGQNQAFESWEGFPSSKALADHLRLATRRCYGAAIRAFLGHLCRVTDAEALVLERRKVAWAREHLPPWADSQVGRVVDRFALVALADELAAEWGIAPWPSGLAEWAAEVCLQAWLAQRGGIRAGEHERSLAAMLGFIERHGSSRFADWDNQGERVAHCAGFRRRDGQGRMGYLFHSQGFQDACFDAGSGSHIPTGWFRVGTAHALNFQWVPTGSQSNSRGRESDARFGTGRHSNCSLSS